MKSAKSFFFLSMGALTFLAGCGNGDSSNGFQEGGSSGFGSSTGTGGGSSTGSGASGMMGAGATTGAAPMMIEGGIACGFTGACAVGQECCMSGLMPRCVPTGACMNASSLDCTSGTQCTGGGGMCCFAIATPEAGAGGGAGGFIGGGGGGGGLGGPMMTYTATCTSQCAVGDMVHYQLCADATECPTGQQCTTGTYGYKYCNSPPEGGTGFMFPMRDGGAGMPPTMMDGSSTGTMDATVATTPDASSD
ncbi:MAG TPA: hypothetical protein VKU41_14945 [Polyangiaceae bacterium]|nr:hypothetical protein [Polyangiaceae bacterium]